MMLDWPGLATAGGTVALVCVGVWQIVRREVREERAENDDRHASHEKRLTVLEEHSASQGKSLDRIETKVDRVVEGLIARGKE